MAKHDAVVLHAAVIDVHGFSKKFAVLKGREEWELKIFVSQLKMSCEYYHLSGKQWRRLCVWAACLFRTNLHGRLFLMQSVEHGTRFGGYLHILVKAVKRVTVTVSSYFRDCWRGNWGKMRIGLTLEWRPRRRTRQGGRKNFSCFLKHINVQKSVTLCVCANLGRTHCTCKGGQYSDISVIHCKVEIILSTHLHTVSCGSITVSSGHGLAFFESSHTRMTWTLALTFSIYPT